MQVLNFGHTNHSTLLLLIALSVCAQLLPAQSLPPQKRIRRPYQITPPPSLREKIPDPPLLASFSRSALPQRPQPPWLTDENPGSFTARSKSYRQPVNVNLLLPSSSGTLPSWTAGADKNRTLPDRDSIASTFASTHPASDRETPNPFIDPQYFARRIPGVGPIVDRILKQSEAHPRLTRVLKSIQPQF